MIKEANGFNDNEYNVLIEISQNKNISQRELSKILGISVSTVNVLLKKMITDGLIKMNHVSQKQVIYMLTPNGIIEKAKKTVVYLKRHYNAINDTVNSISKIFKEIGEKYDTLFILKSSDEIQDIINIAVRDFIAENPLIKVLIIDEPDLNNIRVSDKTIIINTNSEKLNINENRISKIKVFNLIENL